MKLLHQACHRIKVNIGSVNQKLVNLAGDFAKVVIPDGKYFVFDLKKYAFSEEKNKRVKVVNWV